jgi:hypothetical protein
LILWANKQKWNHTIHGVNTLRNNNEFYLSTSPCQFSPNRLNEISKSKYNVGAFPRPSISVSLIGFQALSDLFLENSIGALLCVCDVLILRFGNLEILFNIWNFDKENFAIFLGLFYRFEFNGWIYELKKMKKEWVCFEALGYV